MGRVHIPVSAGIVALVTGTFVLLYWYVFYHSIRARIRRKGGSQFQILAIRRRIIAAAVETLLVCLGLALIDNYWLVSSLQDSLFLSTVGLGLFVSGLAALMLTLLSASYWLSIRY